MIVNFLFICFFVVQFSHATAVYQYQQNNDAVLNDISLSSIPSYSFSYTPEFVNPEILAKQLKNKFPNITIVYRQNPDFLDVTCPKELEKNIIQFLHKIDIQTSFFTYILEIISISEQSLIKNQGIFSKLGEGFYTNDSKKIYPQFQIALKKLLETGEATIIAKPTFEGKLGSTSKLSLTDHSPYLQTRISNDHHSYQLNFIENGFHIVLNPIRQSNQNIEFNMDIKISNIKLWKNLADGSYPILSKTNYQSSFSIELSTKKVIAHIIDEKVSENKGGFSPLKNIPIIKSLFQNKSSDRNKSWIFIILEVKNKALE